MKKHEKTIFLAASLTAALSAQAVLIPNGDFEDPAGPATSWVEDTGETGNFTYFYPETDGSPDGHAIIDNEFGGFGVLIANNNAPITLASLGLVPGKTYRFSQDMRFSTEAIVGFAPGTTKVGGLKIEFLSGTQACGDTGDLFPDLQGDGSSWATYDFDVNIPGGADRIKVVLLWGEDSTVSFDNVSVNTTALPDITEIPNGDFEIAAGDSWEPDDDDGNALITFPALGGNNDGFALIDTTSPAANFGTLVSHSGDILPLAGLGLTAGETYLFSQDMRIVSGSDIGGLKVEFFTCGVQHSTTGDLYPASNSGSTWDTYTFPIPLPPAADGIKVVLLGGSAAEVGFDNVTFNTTPETTPPPAIDILNGDFSDLGRNWGRGGEDNTTISFLEVDGNPGSCAQMANNGSGFGVLVANADSSIPIERLGLSAGSAYNFSMDTYRASGTDVAKFKVEFYSRGNSMGNSGDLMAATVTGSWTKDDFLVSIPSGIDAIRVVPVAGINSVIRYDNVTVDTMPVVAPPVPNLDFEEGAASWGAFGQPNTTFSFPANMGAGDSGYGRMDNNGFGFGVLVANSGNIIPLADLGLTADSNIDLDIDMKIFEGPLIGGVKIEYYSGTAGGFSTNDQTEDKFPDPINDGVNWETYSFRDLYVPATIAAGGAVDGIKIVLIAGIGSDVGFDNVTIVTDIDPVTITITDSGFDGSGDFYIDVAEGVSGLQVTSSPDLATAFTAVANVTNDGDNRFTIPAASLDGNSDGADFFRVEEQP